MQGCLPIRSAFNLRTAMSVYGIEQKKIQRDDRREEQVHPQDISGRTGVNIEPENNICGSCGRWEQDLPPQGDRKKRPLAQNQRIDAKNPKEIGKIHHKNI